MASRLPPSRSRPHKIARLRGDLKAALVGYKEAQAIAQEIADNRAVAYALAGTGDVLADQGDLQAARSSHQESLTLCKEIGDKQAVAETELASMARLSIEEGHAADAETVIRKCKEQFHQDQQADDELAASVVLIDALLAENPSFLEAESEGGGKGEITKVDKSGEHLAYSVCSSK